ncbi:MFS transporter, partial [Escherichia coli]|uniref:MFS transporter n=1 Tax=Escherichia coli TaxID=562 RepID=UPI0034D1D209
MKGNPSETGSFIKRSKSTIVIAWIAFLGPFGYGFLESSLNEMYPVYAMRNGMELTSVSMILAIFSIGGIVSQLPLGMLSDKFGRQKVIPITYGG